MLHAELERDQVERADPLDRLGLRLGLRLGMGRRRVVAACARDERRALRLAWSRPRGGSGAGRIGRDPRRHSWRRGMANSPHTLRAGGVARQWHLRKV
eukprot:scaffold163956_cov27-Tisochrysis_lutea.AAC.2